MNFLQEYILEKFKLSKDTKFSAEEYSLLVSIKNFNEIEREEAYDDLVNTIFKDTKLSKQDISIKILIDDNGWGLYPSWELKVTVYNLFSLELLLADLYLLSEYRRPKEEKDYMKAMEENVILNEDDNVDKFKKYVELIGIKNIIKSCYKIQNENY